MSESSMTFLQFQFLTTRNHEDRGFIPCGVGGTTPHFWFSPTAGIVAESGDQWQTVLSHEAAEMLGVSEDNLPSLVSWDDVPQPRWDEDTSQPAPNRAGDLGGPFRPGGPWCVGAEIRPGELWWAY